MEPWNNSMDRQNHRSSVFLISLGIALLILVKSINAYNWVMQKIFQLNNTNNTDLTFLWITGIILVVVGIINFIRS